MRIFAAFALLALGACDVDSDAANDQVRVDYDEQRIRNAASAAARTGKQVGSAVGNVAATTGRAVRNEVGDVDVDVEVRRKRREAAANEAAPR